MFNCTVKHRPFVGLMGTFLKHSCFFSWLTTGSHPFKIKVYCRLDPQWKQVHIALTSETLAASHQLEIWPGIDLGALEGILAL